MPRTERMLLYGLGAPMSHYLNNEEFEKNIRDYIKLKRSKDPKDKNDLTLISNTLLKMFQELSGRILRGFDFKLIDREDASQEAVMICFNKVEQFDPTRGSKAFSYMTACCVNHFRQMYRIEKKQVEMKRRFKEMLIDKFRGQVNKATIAAFEEEKQQELS
jgi:DNA-directed RNA polymerase specialized sigma24 family protein